MNWILPENPFVGLRPFEAEESLLFFGRDKQTRDLLGQLHDPRFLAVVGGSGCGKSSLIRAGLIPKLQGGFLVEERDVWVIAKMKPGDSPILNLATGLLNAIGDSDNDAQFADAIHEAGVQAIVEQLRPSLEEKDANLLLLVDQFEEIFRFGLDGETSEPSDEAADFVSLMLGLAAQRDVPIYVTMTMRSDFLGDCDAFIGLPEAMNRSQYLVPRLTREQRRQAIEGPVKLYQGDISPRLTDRLLNATGDTRDDLPVLQHTLMRCWSAAHQEEGTSIDVQHYDDVGGVGEALSRHAQEALDDMDADARQLTKRLFQALTQTDASNRRIRRPAHLNDIQAITGANRDEIWDIIQRFRSGDRSFLVVSSENPADNPLIDISHESLIRQWNALKNWVDEEVRSERIYRRLVETALQYGSGEAAYYRDPELQNVLDWRDQNQPNINWATRYHPDFKAAMKFLDGSVKARTASKRRRVALMGLAVFALLAAGAAVLAFIQGRTTLTQLVTTQGELGTAQEERAEAVKQKGIAEENARIAQEQRAEALKQKGIAEQNTQIAQDERDKAELAAAEALKQKGIAEQNAQIAQQERDKARAAETEALKQKGIAEQNAQVAQQEREKAELAAAEALKQENIAAAESEKARVAEADALEQEKIADRQTRLAAANQLSLAAINNLDVDPERSVLLGIEAVKATYDFDETVIPAAEGSLHQAVYASQVRLTLKGHTDYVWGVAYSPDGTRIATASLDNTAKVWDAESGAEILSLKGHTDYVYSVAYSPDGTRIATASADRTTNVYVLDIEGLLKFAGSRVTRELTAQERRQYLGEGGLSKSGF